MVLFIQIIIKRRKSLLHGRKIKFSSLQAADKEEGLEWVRMEIFILL